MTERTNEPRERAADDARLIETIRADYAPRETTPAETAAFNRRLAERIERRRVRRRRVPAFVLAGATAAAAAWLALPTLTEPVRGPEAPETVVAEQAATTEWVEDLVEPTRIVASNDVDSEAMLPDEYTAIASAFLGG